MSFYVLKRCPYVMSQIHLLFLNLYFNIMISFVIPCISFYALKKFFREGVHRGFTTLPKESMRTPKPLFVRNKPRPEASQ